MHLYSNSLSTIATISSLFTLEVLSACFYCSIKFNLSHSLLGSNGNKIVEIPVAMIAGNSNRFLGDLVLLLFRPFCLILKFISFPNS